MMMNERCLYGGLVDHDFFSWSWVFLFETVTLTTIILIMHKEQQHGAIYLNSILKIIIVLIVMNERCLYGGLVGGGHEYAPSLNTPTQRATVVGIGRYTTTFFPPCVNLLIWPVNNAGTVRPVQFCFYVYQYNWFYGKDFVFMPQVTTGMKSVWMSCPWLILLSHGVIQSFETCE